MKDESSQQLRFPFDVQSGEAFTAACEMLIQGCLEAVPDKVIPGDPEKNGPEALLYGFNPGDRNESAIYFPSAGEWKTQPGDLVMKVKSSGELSFQFSDDKVFALALKLDSPGEILEVIEFLEWATSDNLALQGEVEEKPMSWFEEIGSGQLGAKGQGESTKPEGELGRKELRYRPEMGLVHHAVMQFLPQPLHPLPHLRFLLRKDRSEMALRDFLMRSPEGIPMREAMKRGPREFMECLKMTGPMRTPMTLFQQVRDSVEVRMKKAYAEMGGAPGPSPDVKDPCGTP